MGSSVSPIVANIYITEPSILNCAHKESGGGMLMTPLWFNISYKRRSFSNTSIQWMLPSNSLWKNLDLMVPYPFEYMSNTSNRCELSPQMFTGSPPTLICTSNGIVTTILQQYTVCSTPSHTGSEQMFYTIITH